ncbi:hypothetical protein C0993_000031 [Termitomyces sp. T159_Od127]|nr:hypothetical protein C0993_000031 [Termitomyces sp. T159_Od127]
MLKTLYDHFAVLYHAILPAHPALASEHALRQEEDVYNTSSKLTYRNAVITCAAALKRRPIPDSLAHDSVGTEADLAARAEARRSRQALRLTRAHLEPHLMSTDDLQSWGYFLDVPEGPGGSEPSLEGKVAKCERCAQPFLVKRREDADQCVYHWGKPFTTKAGGHLSPLTISIQPTLSDYDHTLRLYPLPTVLVMADKYDRYKITYTGCHVLNPGSFIGNSYSFATYKPAETNSEECVLDMDLEE